MLIQYTDSWASILFFSMLIWWICRFFYCLNLKWCRYDYYSSILWQSHLQLLSHPGMTKRVAVSFVPQFCGCKLQSMSTVYALRCSYFRVTSLISSAVMQSGMSIHDSTVLMVICMPGISSLFLWLCLDSQYAMNSCDPGLYSIPMLNLQEYSLKPMW